MTHENHKASCSEYAELSRRGFLARSGAAMAAGITSPAWMPRVAMAAPGSNPRDVMVHVFLRGGIDGMTAIVPHGDADFYNLRPNIAVPPPGQQNGALDLDGFFGVNPNGAPLLTPYNNGHLAIVHAAGSTDPTLSHFDAMKAMEGGVPNQSLVNVQSGWLGRHLNDTTSVGPGYLRGPALSDLMPLHMVGSDAALPINAPQDFEFIGRTTTSKARRQATEAMYVNAEEPLASAAAATFATVDLLASVELENYSSAGSIPYPTSLFGQKLRATAAMIKAGIALEAVGIDYHGWDHHESQGPLNGIFSILFADLTLCLEAFYLDLLADGYLDSTVTLVMTEFGRRADENGSLGTDHGHASMMLAMGGHIAGGQVFSNWPGLAACQLVDSALAVTTDYRDVTGEILVNRMGNTNLGSIFPNHTPQFIGITV